MMTIEIEKLYSVTGGAGDTLSNGEHNGRLDNSDPPVAPPAPNGVTVDQLRMRDWNARANICQQLMNARPGRSADGVCTPEFAGRFMQPW